MRDDLRYTVLASNVEKKDAKLKPSTAGDSALDTAQTNDYDRPTFGTWRPIFSALCTAGAAEEGLEHHECVMYSVSFHFLS